MRFRGGVVLAGLCALFAAHVAAAACPGDCGGDAVVSIDELILSVAIALEQRPVSVCLAADRGGEGQVDVADLVAAVGAALSGCPALPSPTATATASATRSATPTGTASLTPSESPSPPPSPSPSASATPSATASPTAQATVRPNFIIIELDDTRADGIDQMPVTLEKLAAQGVQFHSSFVPFPLCAPSRASLFTGLYALHHQVRAVAGAIGGAHVFREAGADQQTMAVWLRDAGYATGLFGKYINAYSQTEATQGPNGTFYVPPGWTRWRAFVSPERYGGVSGMDYALVDEHGALQTYTDHASDAQYSTDLLADQLRDFIADSVQDGKPFLAVYAPYASHIDTPGVLPIPAARHAGHFDDLPDWRPPNWNEADVSDKPRWVQATEPSDIVLKLTDLARLRAYETLLAVDEQLATTLAQLDALGIANETVVLLTSDNGVTWSEHRLFGQGKECPYEECLRVPLLARYPRGQAAGHDVEDIVLNIDIAATVADLAGVTVPVPIDGRSFRAALEGRPLPQPRSDFLVEHWRSTRQDWLDYGGQPQDGDQLVLLYGDPAAKPRAAVRFEFDDDQQVEPGAVQVPIGPTDDASFDNLGLTVVANIPRTRRVLNATTNRLTIVDLAGLDGVYWVEERDAGGVVEVLNSLPDYFGVRQPDGDLTYVEYETGERELYDNAADPWQLENRAGAPAYAAEQARLSQRVVELSEQ
ncbi:MAG: sulfatase-like hydrolase/transferase [Deltaproteobacteria bacterium]|nr:sulfatase-like hydrolase/transferase [Deltaproteobacteria bacterium]